MGIILRRLLFALRGNEASVPVNVGYQSRAIFMYLMAVSQII